MFFPVTSFHTFFMVFLIPHYLLRHTHFMFYSSSDTKGSCCIHNLGGVKCQQSLKCSGYYVAHLTPLNLADWLESFLSLLFCIFFQAISIQKTYLGLESKLLARLLAVRKQVASG